MSTATRKMFTKQEQAQFDSQIEQERNGAPVPKDIAHLMTKPKEADIAYQVFVDIKGEKGSRPVSPKFMGVDGEEVCNRVLETINAQICLGRLKGWGNARVERAVHVNLN